jgi:pimeloyl-ACP methyl ester carboxylesterase
MPEVTEHRALLDGSPIFWREAPTASGTPVLHVHGVPTSSDDWTPFLAHGGGLAPDLPGFGRSGKRGDGAYTMEGFDRWLERFLDHLGVDRFRLLVHDWGGVGLLLAQRFPERVERLVVMDAVPLLPGYRWHRIARLWRTPGLGEVLMGLTTGWAFKQLSRESNAAPGPMPDHFRREVLDHLDVGTQRAILRLYRSSPPEKLALAGLQLGRLACPALVVWGDQDPYIAPSFADAYAQALSGCDVDVLHLPDAGHWPWLDRPDLVATVSDFLTS